MTDRSMMPHGTIICPHCHTAISGLLDVIYCDECGRLFWPAETINQQLQNVKEEDIDAAKILPRKHFIIG